MIGYVPSLDAFELRGLDAGAERFEQLFAIDPRAWLEEVERNGRFLAAFGDRLPLVIRRQHDALRARLQTAIS